MLRKSYESVRVHFTNVASGKVIDAIKEAQNDGLEVKINDKSQFKSKSSFLGFQGQTMPTFQIHSKSTLWLERSIFML